MAWLSASTTRYPISTTCTKNLPSLASIIVFPQLSDLQRALPHVDPGLIGHDIAYPAMLRYLPAGFIGLMVGGLIAANSSTILTHLNWGASYLVHDFYRQFVRSDAAEGHYVVVARLVTVLLFVLSSATVYLLDTAKDAWSIASGNYHVRYFFFPDQRSQKTIISAGYRRKNMKRDSFFFCGFFNEFLQVLFCSGTGDGVDDVYYFLRHSRLINRAQKYFPSLK